MDTTVRMGRTRKQAAAEGRRVLAIGKAAGLTDRNPTFSQLENDVLNFEQGGFWDAEFLGPISENITEAEYAARNVLEIAEMIAKRHSIAVPGGLQCSECECVNAHDDTCSVWLTESA